MPLAVNRSTTELKVEGFKMSDPKLSYFQQEDILHLTISDQPSDPLIYPSSMSASGVRVLPGRMMSQ